MKYSALVGFYERLGATTKKLEKRDILAELYSSCSSDELPSTVLLSMGVVFPVGEELGIASAMMKRIISKVCGVPESSTRLRGMSLQ